MALTKPHYSMIAGAPVNVIDYGADNTGATDSKAAIQLAIDSGSAVYFPEGTYTVGSVVSVPTGMMLFANQDATIVSTIATTPGSYQEIFVASAAVSNIKVVGLKFQTAEVAFAAIGFRELVTNLELSNNECQGCSLVTSYEGTQNAFIENNYIHSPAHEGVINVYARAIHLTGAFIGTGTSNVNISNNTILGGWTHGIEVYGGFVQDELDPTVPKNANGVVVSGNIVRAPAGNATTAGAIWFSQVADVTVTGNVCEAYWDVGIDFESCRNAVASGNTLKNNNKNLAMYGNSKGVTFSNNACNNTVAGLSHFYSKPANENTAVGAGYTVDIRNTDILIDGNTFTTDATVTGFETLDLGSGGVVTVSNNVLNNTCIYANRMSLTEVIIKNNVINHNDSAVGMIPIFVAQSYATGDASTTPFKSIIQENVITHSNPAATAYSILTQIGTTVGASIDFDYYSDIVGNEIRSNTSQYSIYVQSTGTIIPSKYLYQTIRGNNCWGLIDFLVTGNRTIVKNIKDNLNKQDGLYSTTLTAAGALNTWDLSLLDTSGAGAIVYVSLADGDYNGQQKTVIMSGFATYNGIVIIATHRLGLSQQAVFSGVGQYCILQWNVNAWDTVVATCAGI